MNHHPPLCGHSGAILRILSKCGHPIVRKSSPAIEGNARLIRQMEKQQAFAALGTPIQTPEILDSGTDAEGRFFFDMHFIAGLDGHRFLETCSPSEVRDFAEKLSQYLSTIMTLPDIGKNTIHHSLFESCVHKLIEVHHKHAGLGDELVGKILGGLISVRELNVADPAFCHGDFTLENIIIDTKGNLAFVDFLDSTFEHPIQDFIKLSQDIHGGWFRIQGRRISSSFIAYLETMLDRSARNTIEGYDSVKNILLALNFCRILPYARSEAQKASLLQRIHQFSE